MTLEPYLDLDLEASVIDLRCFRSICTCLMIGRLVLRSCRRFGFQIGSRGDGCDRSIGSSIKSDSPHEVVDLASILMCTIVGYFCGFGHEFDVFVICIDWKEEERRKKDGLCHDRCACMAVADSATASEQRLSNKNVERLIWTHCQRHPRSFLIPVFGGLLPLFVDLLRNSGCSGFQWSCCFSSEDPKLRRKFSLVNFFARAAAVLKTLVTDFVLGLVDFFGRLLLRLSRRSTLVSDDVVLVLSVEVVAAGWKAYSNDLWMLVPVLRLWFALLSGLYLGDDRGNLEEAFLLAIAEKVIELSTHIDLDVKTGASHILEELKREELRFTYALKKGEKLLEEMLADALLNIQENGIVPCLFGEDTFLLYDTYGFSMEITQEVAEEHGVRVVWLVLILKWSANDSNLKLHKMMLSSLLEMM
ncbi:Alanyl-tRNA synthetase, class IIc, N-terminal [Dillenia turbinata]|uniref:Alanyl-tRNA synthetase, class IIc, N-terminal n=1 Tax=Dillenia turbinata TaxID=194707 RepID=A0AAN8ZAE9_9MAGN